MFLSPSTRVGTAARREVGPPRLRWPSAGDDQRKKQVTGRVSDRRASASDARGGCPRILPAGIPPAPSDYQCGSRRGSHAHHAPRKSWKPLPRQLAQPGTPKRRPDVKVVNHGGWPAVLHAVGQRYHDVPDLLGFGPYEPDVAQPVVSKQRSEPFRCPSWIEDVGRAGIKLGHHGDQRLKVVWSGPPQGMERGAHSEGKPYHAD